MSVHEAEKLSLGGIAAFLRASKAIQFLGENRQQVYAWIEQVLRQQQYLQPGRKARGLPRRYLEKMTALSRRWRLCWPCPRPRSTCRDGLTLATLQRIAARRSDTGAAQLMQQAKRRLFEQFRPRL